MEKKSRTFKALTLLAGCMTSVTLLLGQLEPQPDQAEAPPTVAEVQAYIRHTVVKAAPVPQGRWQDVEIVTEQEVGPTRRETLSAVPQGAPCHFRIFRDGVIVSSSLWHEQRTTVTDGTIRIALDHGATDGGLSSWQGLSLRLLLGELSGFVGAGGTSAALERTIHLSEEAARWPALRACLRSAGLAG